jgi:hypothetical protein
MIGVATAGAMWTMIVRLVNLLPQVQANGFTKHAITLRIPITTMKQQMFA